MRMLACLMCFGVRCRYAVQNVLRTTPVQAAHWLIGSPEKGTVAAACAVTEGLSKIVILPASQRPHVRAIECDLYDVGRGNAKLKS